MKTLKICAISDTHNRHKQIKAFQDYNSYLGEEVEPLSGDIIIHAGDATGQGRQSEIESFIEWFGQLDFRYKIFVPGNHDYGFETNQTLYRTLCEKNGIILLNHESITIEGVKIFGSPWTPWFYDWAFNAGRTITEAAFYKKPFIGDLWSTIPKDTNILVTHGPAYGVLDELLYVDGTPKGQYVGCVELAKKIKEIKPDLHICGHIHCGYGQLHWEGTSYYNVSVCDEMYTPSNAVTVIDYEYDSK